MPTKKKLNLVKLNETYRFVEESGVKYVQTRTEKGWSRKIRAEPSKNGWSLGFRNLIRQGKIPAPSGYRYIAESNRLYNLKSLKGLKSSSSKTKIPTSPKFSNIQVDINEYKPRKRQFELKMYTKVKEGNTINYSDVIVVDGVRYKKASVNGQPLIFVDVDFRSLKSFLKKGKRWETISDKDGILRTDEFLELIKDVDSLNWKRIQNTRSYWEENNVVFEVANIVNSSEAINNVKPIEFGTMLVKDDPPNHYEPILISPYIDYMVSKDGKISSYENLQGKYLPSMCFFSNLINIFRTEYNKKKRQTSLLNLLDYKNFVDFIFEGKYSIEQIQQRGVCFDEMKKFFERFGIQCIIYDVQGQIRLSYEPPKRNSNIRPNSVYFTMHDNHLFHLNKEVKSLSQTTEHRIVRFNVHDLNLEGSYFPSVSKKKEETESLEIVSSFEEVSEIVKSDFTSEKKRYIIVSPYILKNLPYFLLRYFNIQPSILMKGMYNISNIYLKKTSFRCIESDSCGHFAFHGPSENLMYCMKLYDNLKKIALNREAQSVYNQMTRSILTTYKPSPLTFAFREIDYHTPSTLWDFSKYYTSIFMNMEFLMSFNGFDTITPYENEEIEDYCLYLVVKNNDELDFLTKRFNLTFGKNIRGMDVKILYVLQPSHLTTNNIKKHVKTLYEDKNIHLDEFDQDPRKWFMNSIIGQFGKENSCKTKGKVFKDLSEAVKFQQEQGGNVLKLVDEGIYDEDSNENGGEDLYIHSTTKMYRLGDGFLPIYHYIVETGARMLYELKKDLESVGFDVFSCNTDCLTTNTDIEKENIFKVKFADKYFFGKDDDFSKIGTLKIEHRDKMGVKKIGSIVENTCIIPNDNFKEAEKIELKDEWDLNEIHGVMDSEDRLANEAVNGGCGKSFSIEKYPKRKLFVVPTNRRRSSLILKGMDAITTDTLLGYRMSQNDDIFEQGNERRVFMIRGEKRNLSDYEVIVWEEALMNPTDKLWAIRNFMEKHPELKYLFTYDPRQNQPVGERTNNIKKHRRIPYKLKIIRGMSRKFIYLEKNKRNNREQDVKHFVAMNDFVDKGDKMEMIKYLLKHGKVISHVNQIKDKKMICYRNSVASQVSSMIHRRLHGTDNWFIEGQGLLYKSKKSMVKDVKFMFYKNDTYYIHQIDGDKVLLKHCLGDTIELTKTQIKKHFILPYAETCHAVQGDTIDEKYVIDLNDTRLIDCEWLNTAVGRCTSWDNITFYWNPTIQKHRENELRLIIADMIRGYEQADFKAKRYIDDVKDYISVDWVLNELKSSCFLCSEPFETDGDDCFSVDRIDNSIAYIKTNCRIICRCCNSIKR